jgi:hypothetical protein
LRVTLVAAGLGAGFIGARWYGDHQAKSGAETTVAYVRPPANTQPANRNTNAQPANNANTAKQGPGANANSDSPTKNGTTAQAGEGTPQTGKRPGQRTKNGAQNSGRNGANAAAGGLATAQPVIDSAPRTGNGGTDVTPDPFFPQPGSGSAQAPVVPTQPQAKGDVASQGANGKGKSFTMPVEDMVVVPRVESPIKYADAEELAAIWNEREIPLDKIGSAERMLTPQVGRVRLVIHGGEMFEGRLYAVGENKVWLDTGAGKMALLSWQVDRIEHITDTAAATPGAKGSEELAGLQHVRVRTPGGVFYGKLLDEDQGNVTLITEDGGRLRLANARVEPAGKSRTRIVDPEKALAQEAASKNK